MKRRKESRGEVFSRRALIMGAGQLALTGVLVGRLQYLQLAQADKYATLAEDNRVNYEPLAVSRGRIVDRFGVELASNDQNFMISMIPEQVEDIERVLKHLQSILAFSDQYRAETRKLITKAPKFLPFTIADNVSWDVFAKVNLNLPFLPGVQAFVGEKRSYGLAEQAAHVVGYVGSSRNREGRAQSTYFKGRAGLELAFEDNLKGEAGNRRVEVNALGRIVRELERRDGNPGDDLRLAIDAEIQKTAAAALGDNSGSIVVMDAQSGDIYALASTPGFDPNLMSVGIDERSWNALLQDDHKPLMNKALSGQYAPGSTFKMIVALAALEAGVVSREHELECTGAYRFGGQDFHCWEKDGHGIVGFNESIARSCDVFFYDLALKTGIDAISAMARRFGFGRKTGVEVPGEKMGVMPDRDWKRANYAVGWQPGETVITGIGQGYILTTPIQLAAMTAALANGTHLPNPRTVMGADSAERQELGLNPQHVALVQSGMIDVVNDRRGTAVRSRINVDGMKMAGKTGTVQVRRITKEEREAGIIKNEDLPWTLRDHALFVGYAPLDNPRFVIATVVEHGGGGSSVAAPLSSRVMKTALGRKLAIEAQLATQAEQS